VIVKSAWEVVNEATRCRVGEDYESIVKLWFCNKKYGNVNMVVAAVC
jgi:glutathione peroxidase-family protein